MRYARPGTVTLAVLLAACTSKVSSNVYAGTARRCVALACTSQTETAWWERVQEEPPTTVMTSVPSSSTAIPSTTSVAVATHRIVAPGDLLFDTDSATVTSAGESAISALTPMLREAVKITVAGATDATGSPSHNVDLSRARAEAVRAILVRNGVAPLRIHIEAWAATRPVADEQGPDPVEARARNRRVEIVAITRS